MNNILKKDFFKKKTYVKLSLYGINNHRKIEWKEDDILMFHSYIYD